MFRSKIQRLTIFKLTEMVAIARYRFNVIVADLIAELGRQKTDRYAASLTKMIGQIFASEVPSMRLVVRRAPWRLDIRTMHVRIGKNIKEWTGQSLLSLLRIADDRNNRAYD